MDSTARCIWWYVLYVVMCCIVAGQSNEDGSDHEKKVVNFAAQSAGAVVLESSPGSKGYHNLLHDDKDKYGISPCSEKKWVVIGLSEDIIVKSIVLSNFEKYSSTLKEFQVLVSSSYPVQSWVNLGTYTASPTDAVQTFHMTEDGHWGRYLKLLFLSHYGDEFFCTLSQIKVHGSTMIESLKTEVEKATQDSIDIELLLLQEQHENSEDTAPTLAEDADVGLPEQKVESESLHDVTLLQETCTPDANEVGEHNVILVEHEEHVYANLTPTTIELGGENEQYVHVNVTLTDDVDVSAAADHVVEVIDQAKESSQSNELNDAINAKDASLPIQTTEEASIDSQESVDDSDDSSSQTLPSATQPPDITDSVDNEENDDNSLSSRWSVKGVIGSIKEMMNGGNDSTDTEFPPVEVPDAQAVNQEEQAVVVDDATDNSKFSDEPIKTGNDKIVDADNATKSDTAASTDSDTIAENIPNDSVDESTPTTRVDGSDNDDVPDSVNANDTTAESDMSPAESEPLDSNTTSSSTTMNITSLHDAGNVTNSNSTSNITSPLANITKTDLSAIQNITNGVLGLVMNATTPFNTTKTKLSVATCLETLKFAEFQSKMKAKLQLQQSNEPEKTSGAQQDVFKLLMQKIKTLELNYRIIELHALQVGECYQLLHGDYAEKLRKIELLHNSSTNESNTLHEHATSNSHMLGRGVGQKNNATDELRLVVEMLYRNVFSDTNTAEGELIYLLIALSLALSLFAIAITVCCLVCVAFFCFRVKG